MRQKSIRKNRYTGEDGIITTSCLPTIPHKSAPKLWPHQARAYQHLKKTTGAGLWWEMGTGKTAPVLRWIEYLNRKTLIVTVKAAIKNWKNEAEVFVPDIAEEFTCLRGTTIKKVKILDTAPRIVIVNYDAFVYKDFIKKLHEAGPWDIVILDESHKIKSPSAKRTKAILKFTAVAKYRACLTGTPILNGLQEIYTQLLALDNNVWLKQPYFHWSKKRFIDENANKHWATWPKFVPTQTATTEIQQKMAQYGSTLTKEDVLKLPPLIQQNMHCELNKTARRVYKELEKNFLATLREKDKLDKIVVTTAAVKLLRLLQVCSGLYQTQNGELQVEEGTEKLSTLKEILNQCKNREKSIIIWTPWRGTYKPITKLIEEVGLQSGLIIGGQPDHERDNAIADFQEKKIQAIVANPAAGGVGINLTTASVMVYFARTYNLEHDKQSQARAHRGGSEKHSRILRIDLIAELNDGKPTVEAAVCKSLQKKESLHDMILGIRSGY